MPFSPLLDFLSLCERSEPDRGISEASLGAAALALRQGLDSATSLVAGLAVAARMWPNLAAARKCCGPALDRALGLAVGLAAGVMAGAGRRPGAGRGVAETLRSSEATLLELTAEDQLLSLCGYCSCARLLVHGRHGERPALGWCSSVMPFLSHLETVIDIARQYRCPLAEELAQAVALGRRLERRAYALRDGVWAFSCPGWDDRTVIALFRAVCPGCVTVYRLDAGRWALSSEELSAIELRFVLMSLGTRHPDLTMSRLEESGGLASHQPLLDEREEVSAQARLDALDIIRDDRSPLAFSLRDRCAGGVL